MDIKDRIAAMTVDLGALKLEAPVRFGADQCQRHAHGFAVECDGKPLAQVTISGRGNAEDQERLDKFALVLWSLLNGSEARVADAEQRVSNLRHACEEKNRQIAKLQAKLSDFEVSRATRGPFYAAKDEHSDAVWLLGQPSWGAFGICYANWHELATALPGLRPCGVVVGEGMDAGARFIVMRPIADLAPVNTGARSPVPSTP